jgi:hypothetical protein
MSLANNSLVTLLALGVACLAADPSAQKHASPGLSAIEQADGCLITEGTNKVLFYQRTTKSLDGKRPRAHYIHPLYDLDGKVITEDFPADHLHHRGIFWAWHQIKIGEKSVGDAWETRDFMYDVTGLKVSRPQPTSIRLTTTALWKSPAWLDAAGKEKPYVRETTTIEVHAASSNARAIDFHIHVAALEDGLRIGGSDDEKGYSGFSPRFRFPRNLRFTGQDGVVEPRNTAVDAGPWIDFSGKFGDTDEVSGVAILCHPSLPEFPSKWILRNKASMQNAAYPGRVPVPITRDRPLDLRYRLIVHKGDEKQAGVAPRQAEYENVK